MAISDAPILDVHDYPQDWSEYVGQHDAKRMLQVAAKSARLRGKPLDHVLIAHGTPGIGKTALAALVAREMQRKAYYLTGPVNANMARMMLDSMVEGDVVVYDEFHQVMNAGKKHAEWLLSYLQDGMITGPFGPEKYPHVTFIAATTDPGKIPDSIVSRFPLRPPLTEYGDEEAAQIASTMGRNVLDGLPALSHGEALQIAQACHNNPRAIRALLTVLRDVVIADELAMVDGRYDIPGLLAFQGITPDGLDRTAREYLKSLATEFAGTAGIKALEDRLQQPGGLATIERVLMSRGLVAKTRSGRMLTQAGIRRYRELEEAS